MSLKETNMYTHQYVHMVLLFETNSSIVVQETVK